MSSSANNSPVYSPHEKEIIKLVCNVPVGYVTSCVSIATAIYSRSNHKIPRNGASTIHKCLKNLLGRSTIPAHRVLRNSLARGKQKLLMVRDASHIVMLQAEGVRIDDTGRLQGREAFWDFSESCEQSYRDKVVAADAATYASHAEAGGVTAARGEGETATYWSKDNVQNAAHEPKAVAHIGNGSNDENQLVDGSGR